MTGVLVALVQVKGATCAEREAGSVSLAIQSVCRPTVVVMVTGGSLLVVIQGWVYRGSVCAKWWCGRIELKGFECLERWCGVLGVEGCGRVELRGSVCLERWCGVLGVEGCGCVELRIWFFRSSNSARKASMAALSREKEKMRGKGK